MATPTEVTTEMDVPITVAVPVVQDSHEKPYKADDKYLLQARRILLAKLSSGQEQEITVDMLRKETHHQWRLDYNRWNKKHNRALNRAKALRARDAKDAALLRRGGAGKARHARLDAAQAGDLAADRRMRAAAPL